VKSIRRDDRHGIDVAQELTDVGGHFLHAMFLGVGLGSLGVHVVTRAQLHSVDLEKRLGVEVRHSASANDSKLDRHARTLGRSRGRSFNMAAPGLARAMTRTRWKRPPGSARSGPRKT